MIISGFELVEELGRGATTAVYRAVRDGTSYALKLQRLTGRDDPARISFRREAAILAAIRHDCLAKVFEVGDDGEISYLVMELIVGRTLAEFIKDSGAMPEPAVLAIASDVASALDAAHRVGLVHRDVGPRNVVLRSDGRAVLIDFGLATPTGTRQPEDAVVGTVLYSAPEQTGMVRRPVDRRSDLYSLGAVLFECLTGEPPFNAEDAGEIVHMHAALAPRDVRDVALQPVSAQLARIVAHLLAKDPDDRYQEAGALLADIEALRRGTLGEDAVLGQASGSPVTFEEPPIGREGELEILQELAEECRRNTSGATALVESEPGGGRTRLLAELTHHARERNVFVLEAQLGTDHHGPLGALASAVGRFLSELDIHQPELVPSLCEQIGLNRPGAADSLVGLSFELDHYLKRPDHPSEGYHEFAVIEAAHLIMAIALAAPQGALLALDNAHLADDATHRVLTYLAPELIRLDLFVVLSSRNDAPNAGALGRLRDEMGDSVRRRIELQPLSDGQIDALLSRQLGGDSLEPALANEIAIRANGNPAAAVEYLRSALDAGVLRPSWGRFSVDAEALANLDLTTDLLGLALKRVGGVRPATRWLLTEAAVIGSSIPVALLVETTKWPEDDVYVALDEASNARVVEPQGPDRYAFLNEGVRETLASSLDEAASARAHEALARALEASGDDRPETVYEIARHHGLGEIASDPERARNANHRAAKLALAARADDDALRFLGTAAEIASSYHLGLRSELEADCGTVFARAGRVGEALEHFGRALSLETSSLKRAAIELDVAEVHYARSDGAAALEHARAGLSALGAKLARNAPWLAAASLWRFGLGAFVGLTRIGFGRAGGAARERCRLETRLLLVAIESAQVEMDRPTVLAASLRLLLPANRLGPCSEYVGAYAKIGGLFEHVRLASFFARWVTRHIRRLATRSGEPATIATAKLAAAESLEKEGDCVGSEQLLDDVLRHDERFLQPSEYLSGVVATCIGLGLRGRVLEQVGWLDQARRHASTVEAASTGVNGLDLISICIAGLLDQPTAGLERITRAREQLKTSGASKLWITGYHAALAVFHFGLDELGDPFERAVKEFRSAGISVRRCPYDLSFFYVVQAFARVAQGLQAPAADRPSHIELAARAVRELRLAARTPILRAHYEAARAGLLVLKGRYEAALKTSARGQAVLVGLDGPGAEVALLMVRSRALAGVGHKKEAERLAINAARLAEDFGLSAFVRWAQAEPDQQRRRTSSADPHRGDRVFGMTIGGAARAGGPLAAAGGMRGASRAARQLDALLQVAAAAARVLDPEELARLALDETIRILNGERALLFLTNESSGALRPHIGRDAAGNDLGELTGYSSTIVDKVASSRMPIVLTGTEEGAALGSESAVTHGLRSILVSPLQIEDRLLGVVYLDSRLAKGIFTHDDVEILSAITSHVAFALETARLAEMELSVASERRQRQVAELLRDSMRTVGQSLEPRDVLQSILHTSISALGADAGAILLADGERLEVAAASGSGVTLPAGGYDVARADEPEIAEALRTKSPLSVSSVISERNSPLFGLLGRAGSFIVAPLVVREVAIGSLAVIAHRPNAFRQAQAEVADALARQGVIAYENAQLFTRVQALAQRDELSGIANRRHFFELAGRAFDDARQDQNPLSAMMLDIDHFKDVNDRFGHASGDDVIRAVAQRINSTLGSGDLLGRYGGEEFALVVHAPLAQAVELAERLRNVIAESPVATASGPVNVTASVGVAEIAERDADLGRLLQRTDAALYEAKRSGRDRVSMAA